MNNLQLKPMSTAPRPNKDEFIQLLVLDEYQVMGETNQTWRLVYWLDPWYDRVGGWYGDDSNDLRHPVGWVLATHELSTSF